MVHEKDGKRDQGSGVLRLRLGIVGGGRACKFFLELLQKDPFPYLAVEVTGVCDIRPDAEGLLLAKEMGIYTTGDFRDLFRIKPLDGILELTSSRDVLLALIRERPKGLGILEHNIGQLLRSLFLVDLGLKRAEEKVAAEKEVSEFLIQQTNERIVVVSPDFKIIKANESYMAATTWPKDQVIGARCYEVSRGLISPCSISQPDLKCPLLETLRTGQSAQVIHEHQDLDGRTVYHDIVTYPMRNALGEIVQVMEIWRDITQELSSRWEKHVRELKADMKKLMQEDRMVSLGKLVASSVHEINNPIQGLLTFSCLMRETLETGKPSDKDLEDFKKYLSLMSPELERIGRIVSGLLSFARQSEPSWSSVDINEVLEQVLHLTLHKMDIQGICVETCLAEGPLIVDGDVHQLQQCFLNIVFNAIEAMPQGGRLTVTSALDPSTGLVRVDFKDTGIGIAEEELDHIFDPFFTTKAEGQGTGLGLSIVHGIMKAHKGDVEVSSHKGKETSFVLLFPPALEGVRP